MCHNSCPWKVRRVLLRCFWNGFLADKSESQEKIPHSLSSSRCIIHWCLVLWQRSFNSERNHLRTSQGLAELTEGNSLGSLMMVLSPKYPPWSCLPLLWLLSEITHILCCLSYFISEFSVAYNWKYHSSCTQNNILIMFLNVTPVTKYPWNILSSDTWLFRTWEPDVCQKVLYHPLLNHYASYFLSHLSTEVVGKSV